MIPFLACVMATTVYADLQFWVSVGSYQQLEGAQAARDRASIDLGEAFELVDVETDKGHFYRVAAGPYLRREMAEDQVRNARDRGYSGAWLWADEDSVFSSVTRGTDSPGSGFRLDDETYDTDYSLPEYDSPEPYINEDLGVDDADMIMRREEAPELVEEPPEGFKLNKLRRDAQARPPPSTPANSQPPSQLVIDLNVGQPITLPKYQDPELNMTIDGILDEPVWGEFPGVDSFVVVDPDTSGTPRYRTVLKMFYTERGLYASFQMEQPRSTLVRWYSGRDEGRLNRDNVGITLDTSGEGRYGYWINLALGGNQVDGTVLPERQFSGDWDGAWYGGTAETQDGWDAEIFLPWSQMAMPREEGERKLNAYASRKVAHLDERWAVPALPFTQPLFMSALQPLVLNEVDPRQQWSIFPYASVTQDEVEDFTDSKMGADFFWRPSTNFQVTATLNPDFGNVESDDVIVNLSSFETFFPEKRLFFQESTEIFDATPRATWGNPVTALHTRRIGGRPRSPEVPDDVTVPSRELGAPVELLGAVKVVGQTGKIRYGVLGASEDEAKFDVGEINYYQDGTDYGVARLLFEDKGHDGSYRAVGTISTLAAHDIEDATVHGLDYHYLSPTGKISVDGQFLRSDVDSVGVGDGGFVDVRYNLRRGLNFSAGLSHFDDKLDLNDLGFLRRNDVTQLRLNASYTSSDLDWARKVNIRPFADIERNGDGERTRAGIGSNLGIDFFNRDQLRFWLGYFPERAEDRDSRGNGTYLIEPRHSSWIGYNTDSSKRVSYQFGVNHDGEAYGGSRVGADFGITWRPVDQINVNARASYVKRDGWLLWQGDRDFTTFETREWRPRLNLDYFLTAKQQLRLSAQWVGIKAKEREFYLVPERVDELERIPKPDPESDDFSISRVNMQLRYRWEIAPLSDLYVVYTLNGDHDTVTDSFTDLFEDALDNPVGEQLVVKLRYRLGS